MGHKHTYPVIDNVEVPYNVYCLVEFKNQVPGLVLNNPAVFYKSGREHVDGPYRYYPSEIKCDTNKTHKWCFRKIGHCATGSGGAMTYDIVG